MDFRREVEKELTGKEEEPSELIYFKVYKSQIPVIEHPPQQGVEVRLSVKSSNSGHQCL